MASKSDKTSDQTVASQDANAELEHSAAGVTTRSDAADLGVPMLPGDPSERVGPEDALGASPTRGDYRARIGGAGYQPHTVEPVENPEPGQPRVRIVSQRQNAERIGEVKGRKGGVDRE